MGEKAAPSGLGLRPLAVGLRPKPAEGPLFDRLTDMKKAVVLAIVATLLAPILVDLAFFAAYATSYAGECGPHPTDIPARPCSYGEYLGDFLGDPFAIVGLVMINAFVLVVAGLVAGVILAVVLCVRDLNAPQSHAKWRSGDLRHRPR